VPCSVNKSKRPFLAGLFDLAPILSSLLLVVALQLPELVDYEKRKGHDDQAPSQEKQHENQHAEAGVQPPEGWSG
jgi:hypothetical protein